LLRTPRRERRPDPRRRCRKTFRCASWIEVHSSLNLAKAETDIDRFRLSLFSNYDGSSLQTSRSGMVAFRLWSVPNKSCCSSRRNAQKDNLVRYFVVRRRLFQNLPAGAQVSLGRWRRTRKYAVYVRVVDENTADSIFFYFKRSPRRNVCCCLLQAFRRGACRERSTTAVAAYAGNARFLMLCCVVSCRLTAAFASGLVGP